MSDRRKSIASTVRLAIVELYQIFIELSDRFLIKALSFLNTLVYHAARRYQSLTAYVVCDKKTEQGKPSRKQKRYQANPEAIPFTIDCLKRGDEIAIPLQAISNYQESYWQGIPNSRSTVLRISDFFQSLNLLKRDRGSMVAGVRRTQPFYDIDFTGLLAAAHCIQDELMMRGWEFREVKDGKDNFEVDFENKLFPDHNFTILYLLGSACGIKWCRRNSQLSQTEVFGDDEEPVEDYTPEFDEYEGYTGTQGLSDQPNFAYYDDEPQKSAVATLEREEAPVELEDDESPQQVTDDFIEPNWDEVGEWVAQLERQEIEDPWNLPDDPRDELPF